MKIFHETEMTPNEEKLFIDTVEANCSPATYGLINGKPVFVPQEIAADTAVNVDVLIAFLRSDRPISPPIRNWLANMLDSKTKSNAMLSLSRRRGAKKSLMHEYLHAVEAFVELRDQGVKYEAALSEIAVRFGVAEGQLKKAVARLEEAFRDSVSF